MRESSGDAPTCPSAEIAVVFRDLVFEDQVVAEGIVRQPGDEVVILVRIAGAVRQHDRGLKITLQRLEGLDRPRSARA